MDKYKQIFFERDLNKASRMIQYSTTHHSRLEWPHSSTQALKLIWSENKTIFHLHFLIFRFSSCMFGSWYLKQYAVFLLFYPACVLLIHKKHTSLWKKTKSDVSIIIAASTHTMNVTINSKKKRIHNACLSCKTQMSFIVFKENQKIPTKSLWHCHCVHKVCLYSVKGISGAAITFVSWHYNDSFGSVVSLWEWIIHYLQIQLYCSKMCRVNVMYSAE